MAAANADTWATELSALSQAKPRLITTLREVEKGTSGGISLVGTLSALAGAGLIAAIAYGFQHNVWMALVVAVSGLLGSLVDSLLGATVQAVFWCESCGKETEKHPRHGCGNPTRLLRGLKWLNNDWVNLGCTISAPVICAVLWWLVR
jgi:uncharacterized membrane protein